MLYVSTDPTSDIVAVAYAMPLHRAEMMQYVTGIHGMHEGGGS